MLVEISLIQEIQGRREKWKFTCDRDERFLTVSGPAGRGKWAPTNTMTPGEFMYQIFNSDPAHIIKLLDIKPIGDRKTYLDWFNEYWVVFINQLRVTEAIYCPGYTPHYYQ